jgi:hypothetical protein
MSATPKPEQDLIAAGISHAIAYRLLFTFLQARDAAVSAGADLSALPEMPSARAVGDRYEQLVEEWLSETPNTAASVVAFVDFATIAMADHSIELVLSSSIVGEERDREHAVRALLEIRGWLNQHDIAEYVAKSRADGAAP